jgi:SAM-dependent methyltransferase
MKPTSASTSEHWAADFAERAQTYWTEERTQKLNGDKKLTFLPADSGPLLRALGLLIRDASMPPNEVRKYRQINHMVSLLKPSFCALTDRFSTIRILDAACGRSYLSTLLAWDFAHNWPCKVQVLGVDRSEAMVKKSQERANQIGLGNVLQFHASTLADLDINESFTQAFGPSDTPYDVHAVVSLHACDTATDDAITLAVALDAAMIAVVPCCQAELARKWVALDDGTPEDNPGSAFSTIWGEPHLRRSVASHITDVFRLQLIRAQGYSASAIQFVPAHHSAKNTLIRAVRTGGPDQDAMDAYLSLKAATGGEGIELATRLAAQG